MVTENRLLILGQWLILTSFILTMLSTCKVIKGVRGINNVHVKPTYFTFEEKSIVFLPLIHFGQKQFFNNLRDTIVNRKKNGYTILYEGIIGNRIKMNLDSNSFDNLIRKWRKITDGLNKGTREGYATSLNTVFKNAVAQPSYINLGIDSSDTNADITLYDFVHKYEEYYKEVELDSCDYATRLGSTYTCGESLKNNLIPIISHYRNEQLVERIRNIESKKLVILYGALHIKGVKKLLKKEANR